MRRNGYLKASGLKSAVTIVSREKTAAFGRQTYL